MGQLAIRQTSAQLPVFDEQSALEPVSSLGAGGGQVFGFVFGDASLRAWDVGNVTLVRGRIRALRAEQARITALRADSVEFTGCDVSSLRWAGGRLSRVRFDGCKLLGAMFSGVTMEHVVFTDCKLDYATFTQVRTVGPVMFAGCSLRESEFACCDLEGALFDKCDLHLASFGGGRYRRCDLRGNDLSAVTGTQHLKHVVIDRAQTIALAAALAAELDVTFGDDLPEALTGPSHRLLTFSPGAGERSAVAGQESAMPLSSAVARAIIARSSALRARSCSSSQALRCARAALASSSPSAVALKSTLRPSPGSRARTA
jgi:uncharacterized protein YjbI with pentapeptide repeats